MTRLVSDLFRSWSWSYTFGLVSNTAVHDKTLCDMIMLKCRPLTRHVFFRAISTERVPNVTGHHFLTFFAPSYFFDNKHACYNRRVFSVTHSCCCLTGLGLGVNVLVLFPIPSLV